MNDILFVDLNSCFATIEQQARPMLRGRPVAITNRISPNACIIAASYEAKALGVKVGMRRREADALCPQIIYAETEPSKYIFVHEKLKSIMQDYSAKVVMKSIDEGIIDLAEAPEHIRTRNRYEIGRELKDRLLNEVGDWMRRQTRRRTPQARRPRRNYARKSARHFCHPQAYRFTRHQRPHGVALECR